MKQRRIIKSQVIKAWKQSIAEDYCNQRINSERSLQASFWSQLNQQLSKNRRLFIEPSLTIQNQKGTKKLFPDIVVCNTKEIIAVIELKYLPRIQPKFKKDIESLAAIAESTKPVSIANSRFRGTEKDSTRYPLSESCLFVWAGVHAEMKTGKEERFAAKHKPLDDCYLQLHAVTKANSDPEVYKWKDKSG